MKYLYCLLLIFSFTPALSQLNDSFDDGRFFGTEELPRTVNWYGDRDNFRINESFQLQLDAPSQAGRSQLRTSSSRTINTVWEFYLKSEFTLTTNNYCKVYLASDAEDFNSSLNGLSVRIGYTDKNICLIYEKPNKNNKILIKGGVKRLAGNINEVNVRLSFDKYGNIRLYSKLDKEKEYKLEGECVFNEQLKSEWFGVLCIYTKTRYDMFSFDNILVREMREDEQGEDPGDTPEPGEYESALPYDILFSEIMANPKSGEPEYIELYNASDKTFLLSDYLFYYGDKSLKLPEKELLPQAYCVLTKTTALSFFDADINACGV
ncbi:lamin tail domain-containing protein, partial [Bacteroidales bacterium OttesenSCG-928-I14]|nr:lamin tail domain-containing protein [Bacteroidales bacterium OttesenSCG-928-I14]